MYAGFYCGNVDGQATFDRFIEVLKQIFEGFSLRCATWDGRNFRPESAFLSLMHNDLDSHDSDYTAKNLRVARALISSVCEDFI